MIGERIKELRKDKNLTQVEFGKKLGVSRDVIGNLEYERVEPKEYVIKLICKVFDVNENWLVYGEGPMYVIPKEDAELNDILAKMTVDDNDKIKEIVLGLSKLEDKYLDAIKVLIDGLK